MKLIKQIHEERELLHKMMEALVEERADFEYADEAAKGFAILQKRSDSHLLALTGLYTLLAYAVIGILVLIIKLFRRES